MAATLLKVSGLKVSYGGIQAVKGVDFEVHEGELVTLIGSNGAGKTTTMKAITGTLGLNAGGGNLGVAAVQLAALAVLATAGAAHPRVLIGIYIPLVLIAAAMAALKMHNLAAAKNAKHAMRGRREGPADLGHVAALHRHVRVVHRFRFRVRASADGPVQG